MKGSIKRGTAHTPDDGPSGYEGSPVKRRNQDYLGQIDDSSRKDLVGAAASPLDDHEEEGEDIDRSSIIMVGRGGDSNSIIESGFPQDAQRYPLAQGKLPFRIYYCLPLPQIGPLTRSCSCEEGTTWSMTPSPS